MALLSNILVYMKANWGRKVFWRGEVKGRWQWVKGAICKLSTYLPALRCPWGWRWHSGAAPPGRLADWSNNCTSSAHVFSYSQRLMVDKGPTAADQTRILQGIFQSISTPNRRRKGALFKVCCWLPVTAALLLHSATMCCHRGPYPNTTFYQGR